MKKNNLKIFFIVWLSAMVGQQTLALPCSYKQGSSPQRIADLLGFVATPINICGGYYKEPQLVLACANPASLDAAATTITADNTVSFSLTGVSRLEGNIVVTQPGRKMTADKALLYKDPKSSAITQITLLGNVHYYEAGKHFVAQSVFVDFKNKSACLNDAFYRLAKSTRRGILNAWGQAKKAVRYGDNQVVLTDASYTTCPPFSQTWKLVAEKLHIDKNKGCGQASNAYLLIHNMPLLWLPYFSFSLEKQRKTGFLFPTFAYTNGNGFHVGFPYYLNLAPNYDATLIPSYIFRRGVEFEARFRYLTCHSLGNLKLEVMPYDQNFAYFRATAPQVYGISPTTIPFLRRLANDGNSRGLLSFVDNTHFNANWWSNLELNIVTDDYYLQDFAYDPYLSSQDQLLNQAQINYAADNFRFFGRVQTFQTLHPINQQPILDQYSRIPQLAFTTDYPEPPNHLAWQLNGEYIYFNHPREFITRVPLTTGQRIHLQPSVSLPLITPYSFVIPKLQLDGTFYALQDRANDLPTQISRILPVFDTDAGVYFERCSKNFIQTLEPRLFYLFVPLKNQNDFPVFDTTLPAFNYGQLFRTNRFIGYDRLGDANQLAVSFTSRLLDSRTSHQILRASIGQIIYFQSPSVCLTPNCNNDLYVRNGFSPIVGELNYCFNALWDGLVDVAIAPDDYSLNNASMQLHYRPDPKHIFNIGYDFVRKGDTLTTYTLNSSKNNLNRINLALAWKLNDRWQALGNWNYNLSHGHAQAYFYGFQYDSCCWAMRVVASRILTAENVNDLTTYQTNFYVQLQLKGLGNIGNSDPGNLLTSSIFGYEDTFGG